MVLAVLLWAAGTPHLFASDGTPGESHAPAAESAEQTAADRVLVRVNGHPITAGEVDRQVTARVPTVTGHGAVSPERMLEHRNRVIRELIVHRLVVEAARKAGIKVSSREIVEEETALRARFPDEVAFREAMTREGIDPEQLQTGIAEHLMGRRMQERIAKRVKPPTDAQLKAYYAEHPEKFRIPPQASVQFLMVRVAATAPKEVWETAQQRAAGFKSRIDQGEPFEQVAGAAAGEDGIELVDTGRVHEGQVSIAEVNKAAFALAAGQVSEPVWTLYGYALVHVSERIEGRTMKFSELNRDLFAREWLNARRTEALNAWIETLIAEADLVYGP